MLVMPQENFFGLTSASFTFLNDDTFIRIVYLSVPPPAPPVCCVWVPQLKRLALVVKDFDLNLDSFQRFHRVLPEIKLQTAKAVAAGGFQFCYFFLL